MPTSLRVKCPGNTTLEENLSISAEVAHICRATSSKKWILVRTALQTRGRHLGMNGLFWMSQVSSYILLFIHKEFILKASEHSWLEPSLLQKQHTEEEQLQSKCLQKKLCEHFRIFSPSYSWCLMRDSNNTGRKGRMHECVHTQSISQIMHASRGKKTKRGKKSPEHLRSMHGKCCRIHSAVIFTSEAWTHIMKTWTVFHW